MPTFTPPTERYRLKALGPILDRFQSDRGISVRKKDGVFEQVSGPEHDWLVEADALPAGDTSQSYSGRYAWPGGYVYTVSSAVGTELTNAGYSVT